MPDRCFVAADLPERAITALLHAREAVVLEDPGWRAEKWVAPELLHVTLAFLGPIPDPAFDAAMEGLASTIAPHPAFAVRLQGASAVPHARRANMIWARVGADVDLTGLRDDLLACTACPPDPRAFRPHVTLVRARHPRRIESSAIAAATAILSEAGKEPDGWMSVRSLTVYSSTLGAAGPTYEMVGVLPLSTR